MTATLSWCGHRIPVPLGLTVVGAQDEMIALRGARRQEVIVLLPPTGEATPDDRIERLARMCLSHPASPEETVAVEGRPVRVRRGRHGDAEMALLVLETTGPGPAVLTSEESGFPTAMTLLSSWLQAASPFAGWVA